MPEPIKILACILTTYERNGWLTKEIGEWLANLAILNEGYASRVIFAHNFIPAASARNTFCRQMKDSDCDWLLMLDNDMAPPPNLFDAVKDAPADAGIVAPAFYMWDNGKSKLTLCWGMDKEPERVNGCGKFAPGFHELSTCGTGAIFIRPSILEKIKYPYFSYLMNDDEGMQGTEDIQFCLKARMAGVKIYGNASIAVGHFHSVNLTTMASLLYENHNSLDKPKQTSVDSAYQDSGRSPDRCADDRVPVEAT